MFHHVVKHEQQKSECLINAAVVNSSCAQFEVSAFSASLTCLCGAGNSVFFFFTQVLMRADIHLTSALKKRTYRAEGTHLHFLSNLILLLHSALKFSTIVVHEERKTDFFELPSRLLFYDVFLFNLALSLN